MINWFRRWRLRNKAAKMQFESAMYEMYLAQHTNEILARKRQMDRIADEAWRGFDKFAVDLINPRRK